MAELESEVFLLGHWENFEEMELKLSLPELVAIVEAGREREHRHNKFMAGLKGINLDEDSTQKTAKDLVEEKKRRMEGRARGLSDDEMDFADLGLDIEVED